MIETRFDSQMILIYNIKIKSHGLFVLSEVGSQIIPCPTGLP